MIRRSAPPSSSGLPQRKRTYLPKRTWGNGSAARDRTCSRIQVSGRAHRDASSLLSMNSYCNACKPGVATWVVVAILITAPKSCVYQNFLIFTYAGHPPPREAALDGSSGNAWIFRLELFSESQGLAPALQ